MNLSIKNKLFALILLVSTLTMVISGYIYIKNLDDLFSKNLEQHLIHDKQILNKYIEDVQTELKVLANNFGKDEDLIASLNMISNYEDPKNYSSNIYDQEKNNIIESLLKWVIEKDKFSLGVFYPNGELLAFNRYLAGKRDIGFVSYNDKGEKFFIDFVDKNKKNVPYVINISKENIGRFSAGFVKGTYVLKYTQPIFLDKSLVGYLKVALPIDSALLSKVNEQLNIKVVLKTTKEFIFSNDLDQKGFDKILSDKNFTLQSFTLLDVQPKLDALFIIDQKQIKEKINEVIFDIIYLWFVIFVVTFLISLGFADKLIVKPIESLKNSIKQIKENKFRKIETKSNDEIGEITKEFNSLSEVLKDNISLLNNYKDVMDESSIVTRADLRGTIIYANDNFLNISGYKEEEVIGRPHSIVRSEDTPKETFVDIWNTIKSKKVWKGILKNRNRNGDYYWVDIVIRPILDTNNEIVEYIAVRHDITELMNQKDQLRKMINTDMLTGLGNRNKLTNDLYSNVKNSIAILNIDNFRQINDFYGHHFGDKVIKALATILSNLADNEKEMGVYHLQGDEYLLLNSSYAPDVFYDKVLNIVNFISHDNIVVDDEELTLKLTAGISYEENEKILQSADMALQIARKKHRDIVVYKEQNSLNKEYANNIEWTKKIKKAIEENRVVPYFQPIVNNQNSTYEKYESLIRIIDEEDGKPISPYFFLDIAKKTKYYHSLTKIMLEKTFKEFANKEVEFSVNLTVDDIIDLKIQDYIFKLLNEYDIGNRVVFEIVESESIENFEKVISFIKSIKGFGCKIAIDDFGTGYSNFEYLMKLQADYIKIDGSMIKNIDTDENSKLVVSTIVDFAKKMNMKTVAEFVENESILNVINELEIEYSQGYHFSAPKKELD